MSRSNSTSPLLTRSVKIFTETENSNDDHRNMGFSPESINHRLRQHVRSRRKLHEERSRTPSRDESDFSTDNDSNTFINVPENRLLAFRKRKNEKKDADNFCKELYRYFGNILSRAVLSPGSLLKSLILNDNPDEYVIKMFGCLDLCKKGEIETILLNIQAAVAIISSIMFWVGSQDLLTNVFFAPSLTRELIFSFMGLITLGITDTM